MSIDTVNASGVFRVGDVMSRAWRLFIGNILFFLVVPIVIYVVLVIAFMAFGLTFFVAGWATGSGGVMGLGVFAVFILVLGLTMLGQAVLLLGAFQRLRGLPLRVGDVLHRVLARFMPLFGLAIVWSVSLGLAVFASFLVFALLAGTLGVLVLVLAPAMYVPFAFLLIMWSVVVPACIVEGLGPLASMSRSADLTKGYRWKIFGIMLLFGLLSALGFAAQIMVTSADRTLGSVFAAIWFVVWIGYLNCTIIMIYHDLRVAKEGIDTEQIAAIFD